MEKEQIVNDTIIKDVGNIVLNKLKKFSDVPPNYNPKIKILVVSAILSEDKERLSESISCGLKMLGYPPYYIHFYGIGYRLPKNNKELLMHFCSFLDFIMVDPARRSTCSDLIYEKVIDKKLYSDCINVLNEVAVTIICFAFKRQTANMSNAEMIIRFFDGKFFKKVDKNIFETIKCPDDNRKCLLVEIAKYFAIRPELSESLPRIYKLCRILLDEVKNLFFYEERLQEEERKENYSKGGSKKSSKYEDVISSEQKEFIFQKFKEKHLDDIDNYRAGKRGTVQKLSNFFWSETNNNEQISEISESTTRKWASNILKKYCHD